MRPISVWLLPSLADVLFFALLWFILWLRAHQLFNADGDFARHLAVGRQILADLAIPTTDIFSHTKGGEPFVPYEWLSEVIFALIFAQMGLQGVAVFTAAVAALPFLLLTRWMARDRCNIFLSILLVSIGALATSIHWLARPHLFTILLALLWTRSIQDYCSTGKLRHLLVLPPMMALWTNLHGGFLVGFVVLSAFLITAALKKPSTIIKNPDPAGACKTHYTAQDSGPPAKIQPSNTLMLASAALASLAAVGANPAGYGVLTHVLGYLRLSFLVDNTMEYQSPNFHDLGSQLFAFLLLAIIVSLAATPQRRSLTEIILLAVWTFLALYSARNIPLFVVICLPIVGKIATEALEAKRLPDYFLAISARLASAEIQMGRPLLPVFGITLALWLATSPPSPIRPDVGFDPKKFPVQALSRAEDLGVSGNLFNYFPWGGYILYAGYPRFRVFIDGQTDFYGEALTRDYLKVASLDPNWEEVLDRYRIGWILFPHRSPLSLMLARTPGWRQLYEDGTADIFIRDGS